MTESVKRLHIDLSRVEEVDVIGAVAFASNLAKMTASKSEFVFQLLPPSRPQVAAIFEELEYEFLLSQLGMRSLGQDDMWSNIPKVKRSRLIWSSSSVGGKQKLIFIPKIGASQREKALEQVRKQLQSFYTSNPSANINYGQIHQILHEIVKNTIDHSEQPGVLGLKVERLVGKKDKFSFMHCELGDGIAMNVRNYLAENKDSRLALLAEKGSTADFLHWAFTPGNSSRPDSGFNAGLGLSTIRAAAKGGAIRVYFSDAESLAYVSDFPSSFSHREIRRRIFHSVRIPCFAYFGHM